MGGLDPVSFRAWIRNFRDLVIVCIAAFMLVYETVYVPMPNVTIIGAGLTLLGLPVVLRLDSAYRPGGRGLDEDDPRRPDGGDRRV